MKQPKFVSGPPGTGKTSYIFNRKYKELLKNYTQKK